MTDRELLEKAAKAAGMWSDAFSLNDDDSPDFSSEKGFRLAWGKGWWNPLTDDGDALRLAVKLGLLFKPEFTHFLGLERFSGQDYDDYRAHRRAIVRAAAAIGEAA